MEGCEDCKDLLRRLVVAAPVPYRSIPSPTQHSSSSSQTWSRIQTILMHVSARGTGVQETKEGFASSRIATITTDRRGQASMTSDPPHSLHLLLMRLCWKMLASLHSLHYYFHRRSCSQMLNPLQSLHRLLCRWCSQTLPPPHSLHVLLRCWCSQIAYTTSVLVLADARSPALNTSALLMVVWAPVTVRHRRMGTGPMGTILTFAS